MNNLENRIAVVTGALGGMGKVICRELAANGTNIAAIDVADSDGGEILESAKKSGVRAVYFKTDISSADSVEQSFSALRKEFAGIDILVNCAGLVGRRDSSISNPLLERDFYLEEPYEEWLKVMQVNVWGAQLMVKYTYPLMKSQGGGSIITISSLAGRFGAAAAALSYTASKAALVGLSKQWAKMFGRDSIRSNAIAPGPTQTPMLDSMPDEVKERFRAGTLTGHISVPEDIASAVCFLAGKDSSNITGQVLEINGGCWIPA